MEVNSIAEGVSEDSWNTFKGLQSAQKKKWYENLEKLKSYRQVHGDCALGFRDEDDPDLLSWVKEQRKERLHGNLDRVQLAELDNIQFRWKADYFDDQLEW
eukprot:CAMPEP_0167749988 /NCGR_PEP_ID=MMETSP0110_2-20121227/5730_1 /TAXON_ID=629695 /ORGANISM="Gymnochlora sp., Strain CCMP2014" /LENGTH=100 /DNA_ID=CAMNT_0007635237 /DNA_START=105 /DNA_END=404 /DNA_ORIENTATION=-